MSLFEKMSSRGILLATEHTRAEQYWEIERKGTNLNIYTDAEIETRVATVDDLEVSELKIHFIITHLF